MQKFTWLAPTEIVFGSGAENEVGRLVKKHGGSRVFIIYGGQSAVKSGLLGRVEKSLDASSIPHESGGGVVPNPLLSKVRELLAAAQAFGADFILAVGGGSVHDTAKCVAHGLANPDRDVWDFWCGKAKVEKTTPVGSVITIAAAGSEMSDSSVITNDEVTPPTKRGLSTEFNRCRFAAMNPDLTMTLPVWQIGAGAADIFMHTSERFFAAVLGNYLTDEIAAALFRDVIRFGPIAVKNPQDYDAMSELLWCGSISHNGITGLGAKGDTARDGDWACHQLGMAISALYDSTHGATLSAVWGTWGRYVMKANPARWAQFGKMVYGLYGDDDTKVGLAAIEKTETWFQSLGMPLNLTDLLGHKPTPAELTALTDECTYGRSRTIGSFQVLDYDDIYAIYEAAV